MLPLTSQSTKNKVTAKNGEACSRMAISLNLPLTKILTLFLADAQPILHTNYLSLGARATCSVENRRFR